MADSALIITCPVCHQAVCGYATLNGATHHMYRRATDTYELFSQPCEGNGPRITSIRVLP